MQISPRHIRKLAFRFEISGSLAFGRLGLCGLALALSACAGPGSRSGSVSPTALPTLAALPAIEREYAPNLECVPYARAVSNIPIYGDAWTWWDQAAAHYARGHRPAPGAVLVLRPTQKLKLGHLAVVTHVVDRRQVLITHANWGRGDTKPFIRRNMPVIDVSPDNDWSALRFWNEQTLAFGQVYPSHGFIYNGPSQMVASR